MHEKIVPMLARVSHLIAVPGWSALDAGAERIQAVYFLLSSAL
jgi:hypothetical protein